MMQRGARTPEVMAAGQPSARVRPADAGPPWCSSLRLGALFRRARCCSLPADEAEAVLIYAAGTVPRSEEVQLVDHVVVATRKGFIDPGSLQDRELEGSFQEPPALPVIHKIRVATGEPHRERASGNVIGAQVPGELHVEVADSLGRVRTTRSSVYWVDPRC